jgi:predicted metal-dependent peptidase
MNNERIKQAETLLRGVRLGMINDPNIEKKTYGLTSLDLKLVNNDSVLTMGVDGVQLFYNVDFVLGLEKDKAQEALTKLNMLKPLMTQEEYDNQLYRINIWYGPKDRKTFEFLFRHEVDHIIYEHMQNIGTQDPKLWNIACDHRINNDIVNSWFKGISDYGKQLPILKGACCDRKYKDKSWTSNKIYDDLVEQQNKNGNQQSNNNSSIVDSHIYSDGQGKGQNKSDQVTRDILGLPANFNNPVQGTDKQVDSKVAAERIKNSFVEAAKQVGLGEGNETLQAIKMIKPVLNWKKVLRKNLSGFNKTEQDPKRISRRIHGTTSVLHDKNMLDSRNHLFASGKKPEEIVKAFVFFDTSGSISDKERMVMLTETYGIMKQYKQFEIVTACWGTNFIEKSLKTFNKQNKNELKDYKFISGGGTDVNCIASYLENQKLKSTDKVVIFTDCYFGNPREKLTKYSKHLIFVSTQKNMQFATRKIGKYIEYDKHM